MKLTENENSFLVKDIMFKKNNFSSFQRNFSKNSQERIINNDFSIKFGKKIIIFGSYIDATNFSKFFNQNQEK